MWSYDPVARSKVGQVLDYYPDTPNALRYGNGTVRAENRRRESSVCSNWETEMDTTATAKLGMKRDDDENQNTNDLR